jgi:hypothetical protein
MWIDAGGCNGARTSSISMIRTVTLAFCCLLLGCSSDTLKNIKPAEMGTVSGQVLMKDGQPLPGGKVTFRSTKGDVVTVYDGIIDENGAYSVSVPVGEAQIGVDNSTLAKPPAPKGRQGAGFRQPGSKPPSENKGRYVSIPSKYANPISSGLTYTVEKGTQTHNIQLQ